MESAYKLAIEIVADAKNFETNVNKAADSTNELADKTKEATGEVKEQIDSAKDAFSEMGQNASQVMGSLGSAIGGAKGEVISLAGEMAAATGPIALIALAIGGIASAWKKAKEEVDLYLSRVEKAKLDPSIFTKSSKDAYKETSETAKGGMYEGATLVAQAERRLQLDVGYTDEQKKQLQNQKELGEQLIKDNQQLQQSLGIGTKLLTDQVAKLDWIQKYNKLQSDSDKLDEKKISTQAQINDLESQQLELRTKIMMPGTTENKAKLEKEYETNANDILKIKLSLLDEEKTVKDSLFEMTGKSQEEETFNLNLTNQKAEINRAYNQDILQTVRLMKQVNAEGKTAVQQAEEELVALKKINEATASGHKLGAENVTVDKIGYKEERAGYANTKQLLKNSLFDPKPLTTDDMNKIRQYVGFTKEEAEAAAHANSEFEKQKEIAGMLTDVFGNMFSSIDGGVKAMAQSVIESIEKIAEKLAAEAVVFAIMSVLFPGSGVVAGGIGKYLLGSLIPGMADGGIAYGPTVAQIGEYPGARSDPEVVAPLSNLMGMLGSQQAVPQKMRLALDGQGNLYGYLDYRQRHINNYR